MSLCWESGICRLHEQFTLRQATESSPYHRTRRGSGAFCVCVPGSPGPCLGRSVIWMTLLEAGQPNQLPADNSNQIL